jgi:hypothetical protein
MDDYEILRLMLAAFFVGFVVGSLFTLAVVVLVHRRRDDRIVRKGGW